MGFHFKNRVVRDGLVLYFDAANPESLVSGSTRMIDLVTYDVKGILINGVSYSGTPQGSSYPALNFGGTNGYVQITPANSYKVPFPLSVDILFYVDTITNNALLIRNDNSSDVHWGVTVNVDLNYRINVTYGNGLGNNPGGRRTYQHATPIVQNSWNHFIAVLPNSTTCLGYLNGVSVSTPYASGSATGMTYSNGAGSMGWRIDGTNYYLKGGISSVKIYNKALNSDEAWRNFNVIRSRVGL